MRSTMQKETERQRKHIRWSHAKRFCGCFPIITNTGLFKRCHRKVKRDHISSLWVYFLFFSFCPHWEFQLSVSQRESQKWAFRVYPKAPERKWAFPSVGNTVCLCLHYIPAAIESQGGTIPRMVSRISIQSTKKRLKSKWMIGLVSSLRYGVWPAESRVNSHRRCWGQWSMCWYRSSRQAVGWSTCFFPPESDCFCWRPVDKMERGEESVWTCLQHMDEVIIQPRWQGKSKSI